MKMRSNKQVNRHGLDQGRELTYYKIDFGFTVPQSGAVIYVLKYMPKIVFWILWGKLLQRNL